MFSRKTRTNVGIAAASVATGALVIAGAPAEARAASSTPAVTSGCNSAVYCGTPTGGNNSEAGAVFWSCLPTMFAGPGAAATCGWGGFIAATAN